jgi:hypothetical protein
MKTMKSTFAAVIIGWSVLCGILAMFALPQIRSHFSEQRHYFIWLRSPEKLTGSEEDLRARKVLEEAARRNILKSEFFEKLKQEGNTSGIYVEHTVVNPTFYWLYGFSVVLFWGVPALVFAVIWSVVSKRNNGNAPFAPQAQH